MKSESESDEFDDFGNFNGPQTDNKPETTWTEVLGKFLGAISDRFDD